MREDGNFKITGRAKDIIIRAELTPAALEFRLRDFGNRHLAQR